MKLELSRQVLCLSVTVSWSDNLSIILISLQMEGHRLESTTTTDTQPVLGLSLLSGQEGEVDFWPARLLHAGLDSRCNGVARPELVNLCEKDKKIRDRVKDFFRIWFAFQAKDSYVAHDSMAG